MAGINWLFRSRKTGRITIAQFPNLALWIYIATVALRRTVTPDTVPRTTISVIGSVALAWWALDEVFRGVNPWRRLLGVAGCAFVVAGLVTS